MPFTIALDFDGTIFLGHWNEVQTPNKDVIDKTKEFLAAGAHVLLWTCREGKKLEEAVKMCEEVGLKFHAVNENTPLTKKFIEQKKKQGDSLADRKVLADIYVDDLAPGSVDYYLKINVKETCKNFDSEWHER